MIPPGFELGRLLLSWEDFLGLFDGPFAPVPPVAPAFYPLSGTQVLSLQVFPDGRHDATRGSTMQRGAAWCDNMHNSFTPAVLVIPDGRMSTAIRHALHLAREGDGMTGSAHRLGLIGPPPCVGR